MRVNPRTRESRASSGAIAIQFVLTPEAWPVFVAWFNSDVSPDDHLNDDDRAIFQQDFRDLITDALSTKWFGHEPVG